MSFQGIRFQGIERLYKLCKINKIKHLVLFINGKDKCEIIFIEDRNILFFFYN